MVSSHCFRFLKMFQQSVWSGQTANSDMVTFLQLKICSINAGNCSVPSCAVLYSLYLCSALISPGEAGGAPEADPGWPDRSWPWSGWVPWEGGRGWPHPRGRRGCCPGSSPGSGHWGTCCPLRAGGRMTWAGSSSSWAGVVTTCWTSREPH